MKKSGFTLIELLAVIVILAIIALIATPIVMNTIEKSKKSAAERSADNYIDAVETAIATSRLDNVTVEDGLYVTDANGNLCKEGNTCTDATLLKVEVNGTKPASGSKVAIENGLVVKNLSNSSTSRTELSIDNYKVSYNASGKLVATLASASNSIICTASKELTNTWGTRMTWNTGGEDENIGEKVGILATEQTQYQVGAEYKCKVDDGEAKTFYVFETNKTDNVALIMDRNIDSSKYAPTSAAAELASKTSTWDSSIINIMLPWYENGEIANFGGYWVSKYLCVNNDNGYITTRTSGAEYKWGVVNNDAMAWLMRSDFTAGIRPVIVISKSQMSL